MDKQYRIKTFEIEYSEEVIADLKERVTNIRTFIKENYE
jgi:protein associated with RNAse G/E